MSALPKDSAEIGQGYLLANRFELVRLLHASDSSAVFLASDHKERIALRSLKVRVALKVFDRSGTHAVVQRERIRSDFERVSRFIHKNLVRVFECIEGGDFQAISMEYVDGPPLLKLADERALTSDTVLDLLNQIAGVLTMLHVNGVSHGALDASKILLTQEGAVKVNLLTSQGTLVAHSGLLAPASPSSASSTLTPQQQDVAAVGDLAFRMLHGHSYGESPTVSNRLQNLYRLIIRVFSRSSGGRVPVRLEQAIARALSPDPLLRYHHAGELQRELDEIISERRNDARSPYAPRFPQTRAQLPGLMSRAWAHLTHTLGELRSVGRAAPRADTIGLEGSKGSPTGPQTALALAPVKEPIRDAPSGQNVSSGTPPDSDPGKKVISLSAGSVFVAITAIYLMVLMLLMRQVAVVLRTVF